MLTWALGGLVTLAMQVGAALPGVHTPPLGGVTLAVFVIVAGGAAPTCAVIVYVTLAPAGNVVSVSLTPPLPLQVAAAAPPAAAQVQVWLAIPAGTGSLTLVPFAGTLPVLVTTTV